MTVWGWIVLGIAACGGPDRTPSVEPPGEGVDLADVKGQHVARRALEIAAAGGHPLLLWGPPGCG